MAYGGLTHLAIDEDIEFSQKLNGTHRICLRLGKIVRGGENFQNEVVITKEGAENKNKTAKGFYG